MFGMMAKTPYPQTDRELIRLDMTTESGDWSLWIDDSLKLQRVVNPIENTEVVRD